MPTRAFSAVGCTGGKTCVAFAADLLVAVVLGREHFERGLDDSTSETGGGMKLR
jgi:hypothetical protein